MRVEADLVMRQSHFANINLNGHDVPFPYHVVRQDLPAILEIWFRERELLRPVHDLFFASFYNRHLNIEFQFQGLIQALESLHRRLHKGLYTSKTKYEKCKQGLTAAIPVDLSKDHRDALKNRIKYGNEYSLRKRLTLMGRQLNAQTRRFIDNDFKRFISSVVETRNYLTHFDSDLKAKAMSTEDMVVATFSLRLLLTVYLFKRIGMRERAAVEVIKEHPRFQRPKIIP